LMLSTDLERSWACSAERFKSLRTACVTGLQDTIRLLDDFLLAIDGH
jgi:hypothetical protein